MKKGLQYTFAIAALLVVAYNSVYFKKLDKVKAASTKAFDAKAYARNYFTTKLTPALGKAITFDSLMLLVQLDKEKTFDKYSHALGIGNARFFLVRGKGVLTGINENDVSVKSKNGGVEIAFTIATEFVYGNALRDASGLIDINEFSNTMDLNNISAEVNRIVRSEVLPPFKAAAKKGDLVQFFGAVELNREHLNISDIEVIPVVLEIIHE